MPENLQTNSLRYEILIYRLAAQDKVITVNTARLQSAYYEILLVLVFPITAAAWRFNLNNITFFNGKCNLPSKSLLFSITD